MSEHNRVWCIGFGEFEGKCPNKIGDHDSPLWCERCDTLRKKHITEQFAAIEESFKEKAKKMQP
jgi:hypothetical protein